MGRWARQPFEKDMSSAAEAFETAYFKMQKKKNC